MNIAVIGLGFVGLTTALGLCEKGHIIYGYDLDAEKVDSLKDRIVPFFEPHLEDALNNHLNKKFYIVDSLADAVKESSVIFYCVGTPSMDDGSADLKYLKNAITKTINSIKKSSYKTLVIKSTVPPLTTQNKILPMIESLGMEIGRDVGLANNPEFLREGYSWEDFLNPDRIVLGIADEKSNDILENVYKPFNAPIHKTSLNTGEFIKYLSNTMLSTMISFANEMSMIAYTMGDIDIASAFRILHQDNRWFGSPANMSSYVYPGCGFGGYCLPKDTKAICSLSNSKGYSASLLNSVLEVNKRIKPFLINHLVSNLPNDEYIGILGLSFKPGSDDVRESPAKDFIELLIQRGYNRIIAYDPLASDLFSKTYSLPIQYAKSIKNVIDKTKNIVILTAWPEFKTITESESELNLFDFRYMF